MSSAKHFESLEARALMAGVADVIDPNGDQAHVELLGPGTLVATGGASPSLTVTGSTAASELRVTRVGNTGDGRIQWDSVVSSRLKLFSAPLMDFNFGTPGLRFSGPVKDITVGDVFADLLRIQNAGAGDQTNLTARIISLCQVTTTGRFGDVVADNLVGISRSSATLLQARSFKSITVNNNFSGVGNAGVGALFNIRGVLNPQTNNVFDASDFGVKTLRVVGGVAGGSWQIPGPVASIHVGGIAASGGSFDANGQAGDNGFDCTIRGRVTSVRADRDLRGDWTGQSFNAFVAGDDVDVNMVCAGRLDSVRGEEVNILVSAGTGIGQIVARSFLDGSVFADYVDSIVTTGGVRGPGDSGLALALNTDGDANARAYVLGTMTIAGTLINTSTILQGNARRIDLSGINNSYIIAGTVFGFLPDSATFPAFPAASPDQFSSAFGGRIDALRIRARLGDPADAAQRFRIVAREITNLRSDASLQLISGAFGQFGFILDERPTTLHLRVGPTIETDTSLNFLGSSNFVYRLV